MFFYETAAIERWLRDKMSYPHYNQMCIIHTKLLPSHSVF